MSPKFNVSKLGGGGKYPLAVALFVIGLTPAAFCDGVDKGWLLRLSISFFDKVSEPRSSSKNKLRNFCALNSFEPKYGGRRAFLKMAWDNDNYDNETLSAYFYSYLISRFFRLILSAYLKIYILGLGYVTV